MLIIGMTVSEFLRDSWKEFIGGFIGFWTHHVYGKVWRNVGLGVLPLLRRRKSHE